MVNIVMEYILFKVTNAFPELCESIPNQELLDLCTDDKLSLYCKKSCEEYQGTVRDLNGKISIIIRNLLEHV